MWHVILAKFKEKLSSILCFSGHLYVLFRDLFKPNIPVESIFSAELDKQEDIAMAKEMLKPFSTNRTRLCCLPRPENKIFVFMKQF